MSLVTTAELATHMRLATAPTGAQALIDTAEDVIAAFLDITPPGSGRHPLYEHTVYERIVPQIDRTTLEVSHGFVTNVQTIYTVSGTTFNPIGVEPFSNGWAIMARTESGAVYEFQRGVEYVVEYRTGWSTGTGAHVYDFNTDTPDTPGSMNFQGWTVEDADEVAYSNLSIGGSTRMRWTQTQRNEWLHSPVHGTQGSAHPFIAMRFGLVNTPTLTDWEIVVQWLVSSGLDNFTEERSMRFNPPHRVVASAGDPMIVAQFDMTADVEGKPFEEIQGISQQIQPRRRWIDDNVHEFRIQLRSAIDDSVSLVGETLPVIDIDWITVSDGNVRAPQTVKRAILLTAASISESSPGIVAQRIGDYSVQFDAAEATELVPASARRQLQKYRRPSW
jgi:hypothetical protein